MAVVRALGQVDVGQGCVVQQGIVLAVEAIEGTDAMVNRAARLCRPGAGGAFWSSWSNRGRIGGRIYRPSGLNTIDVAAAAGLRGIAFEAGGTLLTDRASCVARADAAGLFLLGLDPQTGETS